MRKANLTHRTILFQHEEHQFPEASVGGLMLLYFIPKAKSFHNNLLTKNSNLMKKVNFKNALVAFAVTLVFLLVGAGQAEAQLSTQLVPKVPGAGIAYVDVAQAETILNDAAVQQKSIFLNAQPGSPIYLAAYRLYLYYYGILAELQTGKSVATAINTGLFHLNDSNGNGDLTKEQYSQLKQSAVNLLKK